MQPSRGSEGPKRNAELEKESVEHLTDGPGVSHIDPEDPASPNYELISRLRTPLTLRDIMIEPVRTGYVGQDRHIDPKLLPPPPAELFPDVSVDEVFAPSPDGPVRCQVYRPKEGSSGAPGDSTIVLYFHGGGFMVGRSEDTEFLTRKICAQNGVTVISINYRLAPEWPFPTGLDDYVAVYRWLLDGGSRFDVTADRIAFCGDSSGANFAAAMPLRVRDAGLPVPGAVVALAPLCDFNFERYESWNRLAPKGIVYDAAFAGFLRGAYVRYEDWSHPHVSPIYGDLQGYPPALLIVGTEDPIVDSVHTFADKLKEAGSEKVELFVREGMPHGFYFFPGLFKEEAEAYAAVRKFLEETLLAAR